MSEIPMLGAVSPVVSVHFHEPPVLYPYLYHLNSVLHVEVVKLYEMQQIVRTKPYRVLNPNPIIK